MRLSGSDAGGDATPESDAPVLPSDGGLPDVALIDSAQQEVDGPVCASINDAAASVSSPPAGWAGPIILYEGSPVSPPACPSGSPYSRSTPASAPPRRTARLVGARAEFLVYAAGPARRDGRLRVNHTRVSSCGRSVRCRDGQLRTSTSRRHIAGRIGHALGWRRYDSRRNVGRIGQSYGGPTVAGSCPVGETCMKSPSPGFISDKFSSTQQAILPVRVRHTRTGTCTTAASPTVAAARRAPVSSREGPAATMVRRCPGSPTTRAPRLEALHSRSPPAVRR